MLTAPNAKTVEALLPALAVNGTLLILALMPEKANVDVCKCRYLVTAVSVCGIVLTALGLQRR